MTRQWPDDRNGLRLSDGFGEGNETISALAEFEYECVEMSGVNLSVLSGDVPAWKSIRCPLSPSLSSFWRIVCRILSEER